MFFVGKNKQTKTQQQQLVKKGICLQTFPDNSLKSVLSSEGSAVLQCAIYYLHCNKKCYRIKVTCWLCQIPS